MDDQSFDFLFNAIAVATFAALLGTIIRAAMNPTPPKKECKPHSWSHHPETGKLTCIKPGCGYVAGTNKTEHGEY